MNKLINYLRSIFGNSKVEMLEVESDDVVLEPKWDVNESNVTPVTEESQPEVVSAQETVDIDNSNIEVQKTNKKKRPNKKKPKNV